MIKTSHLVHTSIIDLKSNNPSQVSELAFGNKTALLCGDYLLSKSCSELAGLKNQELIELMSSAIVDLSQSEFVGRRDKENNIFPEKPMSTFIQNRKKFQIKEFFSSKYFEQAEKEWILYHSFKSGNFLGKACKGTLKLGGHSKEVQEEGLKFGKHFAFALQASKELSDIRKGLNCFSLFSAPVLFHLHFDDSVYNEIDKGCDNIQNIDCDILHKFILDGPGLECTEKLLNVNSQIALELASRFPSSEASKSLLTLLENMKNV